MVAYYCFVNLGWPPSKYAKMKFSERALIAEFVNRDIRQRKEEQEKIKHTPGRKYKKGR